MKKTDLRHFVQDEIDRRVVFLREPPDQAAKNVALLLRKLADVMELRAR